MKRFQVNPYYWEKCAGEEPMVIIEAETPQEAIEKARPYPWNHTFGARACELKED